MNSLSPFLAIAIPCANMTMTIKTKRLGNLFRRKRKGSRGTERIEKSPPVVTVSNKPHSDTYCHGLEEAAAAPNITSEKLEAAANNNTVHILSPQDIVLARQITFDEEEDPPSMETAKMRAVDEHRIVDEQVVGIIVTTNTTEVEEWDEPCCDDEIASVYNESSSPNVTLMEDVVVDEEEYNIADDPTFQWLGSLQAAPHFECSTQQQHLRTPVDAPTERTEMDTLRLSFSPTTSGQRNRTPMDPPSGLEEMEMMARLVATEWEDDEAHDDEDEVRSCWSTVCHQTWRWLGGTFITTTTRSPLETPLLEEMHA